MTIGVCVSDKQARQESLFECDFYRISRSERLYKLDPVSRTSITNTCVSNLVLSQKYALVEC